MIIGPGHAWHIDVRRIEVTRVTEVALGITLKQKVRVLSVPQDPRLVS
jgi:hypothetical protein